MPKESEFRQISTLDLSKFKKPIIENNRSFLWRSFWYCINAVFFKSTLFALMPNKVKAMLLRFFGAKIGGGFVCKPCVNIKYPWFLSLGDNCWIGEGVWIDNLCPVKIGNNVCLSQGVTVFTGSHNWNSAEFTFFAEPVIIGNSVWVTAFRVIRPGVNIPSEVVVCKDVSASSAKEWGAQSAG